jgi:hypothetical protein
MPTLTELTRLGKQALLAIVAQVLTELAALKARIEAMLAEVASLRAENAALKAQREQRTRDAKRQAAPFSKGQRKARPNPHFSPSNSERGSPGRREGASFDRRSSRARTLPLLGP